MPRPSSRPRAKPEADVAADPRDPRGSGQAGRRARTGPGAGASGGAPLTVAQLRRRVVRHSLFAPVGLGAAVARMGFVQADPIRAPARAQDLILRHRVAGYRAGDLEREYAALGLDEDVVYAYGFVPPATRRLLYPRLDAHGAHEPTGLAREVLAVLRERGPTHPRELARELGHRGVRNAWGGQSRATTRALEELQYWGLLRVARREAGVRVYEPVRPPAEPFADPLPPDERLARVLLLVAALFGPLPERSLRGLLALARYAVPHVEGRGTLVSRLLRSGELERAEVDGVPYVWPAGASGDFADGEEPTDVRFLAPFDPLVWDRRRVEHLWGWAYRFEAYTPAPRRRYGYYALPLLWGDRLVGWANLATSGGRLDVALGFLERRPRDRAFTRALDAEVARVAEFLSVRG